MSTEEEEGSFHVLVLGTGLAESIAAAALSKAGYKVAQVDTNPYYGSRHASLSLEELDEWVKQHPHAYREPGDLPAHPRAYSVSLSPTILPSVGPMISSLIGSGVAKYGGYRLVKRVGVYGSEGSVRLVPSSKEAVFKDYTISLLDKRRLMRFLLFAAGDFEGKPELSGKEDSAFGEWLRTTWNLNDQLADAISYALAYCTSSSEPTLPALTRARQYLQSTGRYGASPFILAHYGGAGEISQGFCRTAAVAGGVYILGRGIERLHTYTAANNAQRFGLRMTEFPEDLTSDVLISSQDFVSYFPTEWESDEPPSLPHESTGLVRCVAIIDQPVLFGANTPAPTSEDEAQGETDTQQEEQDMDTGVLIFPPKTISESIDAAATVLVTGEGSMSAPTGKYIVYISLPVKDTSTRPDEILQPFLAAVLSFCAPSDSPPKPLYTIFYHDITPLLAHTHFKPSGIILTPAISPHLTSTLDEAAEKAEEIFRNAIKALDTAGITRDDNEDLTEIPLWPPNEPDEDEDEDW